MIFEKVESTQNLLEFEKYEAGKFEKLREHTKGRDVYIWGAGHYGASLYKKCTENQIVVKNYIDNDPVLEDVVMDGLDIIKPSVLNLYNGGGKKTLRFLGCSDGGGNIGSCLQTTWI
jgi:hypothetical protein